MNQSSNFQRLFALLGGLEFVVIGGVAALVHGSATMTYDVDLCYFRSHENIERLCRALADVHPTLRGAPKEVPFRLDPPTVQAGLNFTLDTDLGALDLLGEVPPLGGYAQVLEHAETAELFGFPIAVLSLDALIRVKRATGRTKDKLVLPELEALQELRRRDF